DGAHRSIRGDFSNRMVSPIGDINIPGKIDRDTRRVIELRALASSIRSARISRRTCEGADRSVKRDFANRAVASVSYVKVVSLIDGDPKRVLEPRRYAWFVSGAAAAGFACKSGENVGCRLSSCPANGYRNENDGQRPHFPHPLRTRLITAIRYTHSAQASAQFH